MFKRTENDDSRAEPTVGVEPAARPAPPATSPKQQTVTPGGATIGPSIRVSGDLAGDEDLVVQGEVEGTVSLPNNLLTIGKDGRLNATVTARVINVEGHVEGDLNGQEQVVLRRSGHVRGNIVSPRVTIEDGCHFKGSIDMDAGAESARKGGFSDPKVADLKTAAGGPDESKS